MWGSSVRVAVPRQSSAFARCISPERCAALRRRRIAPRNAGKPQRPLELGSTRYCQSVGSRVPFRQSVVDGRLEPAINARLLSPVSPWLDDARPSSSSFSRDVAKSGGWLAMRNQCSRRRVNADVASRTASTAAPLLERSIAAPVVNRKWARSLPYQLSGVELGPKGPCQ